MNSTQVTISNLNEHIEQSVTLNGWVYNKRTSGKIWFLLLRDGTGLAQCVIVKSEVDPEIFELKNTITQETSLSITGIVRKDGVYGNWIWWSFLLTGMLTVFFYAKLWRRSNITTDLEFYEILLCVSLMYHLK